MFLLKPQKLFFVEYRRAFLHFFKAESGYELIFCKYFFFCARIPSYKRHPVQYCLRQIPPFSICVYGEGSPPLGELELIGAQNKRQMSVYGRGSPHSPLDKNLPRGVGHMVLAADDMRDSFLKIIYHNGKMKERLIDAFGNHKIAKVRSVHRDASLYLVMKC